MKKKNKRIFCFAFAAVFMMALASGVSAQSFPPHQEQINAPVKVIRHESILSVAAQVSEAISYQGILEENGVPVTGSRDMTFSLFSDDGCTTFVTGIVDISDVPVDDGLFSVQLDFDPSVFTGQALFLEVEVEGTAIACQEILPVPYALSLRPGAKIETDSTASYAAALTGEVSSTSPGSYSAGLRGINKGTAGLGIGVYGSQDGDGWGVYGHVGGDGSGVYGYADGADGVGVYARGRGLTGTALMLSNGGIRVSGAGVATGTPVFIHVASAGNLHCSVNHCTRIDHPLTNGDPNAILIVTPNWNASGTGVDNNSPIGVFYIESDEKWSIFNQDTVVPILEGAAFNVLVVKP